MYSYLFFNITFLLINVFNSSNLKTLEVKFAVKLLLLKQKNVIFKNTLSVDKLKKQYNLLYVNHKFRNIHSFCPYTFRGRSYFRIFGVSRYLAKRSITFGKFPGFVSASW